MNSLCSTPFFNSSLFWDSVPDFTPCFQMTVACVPSSIFILISPMLLYFARKSTCEFSRKINNNKYWREYALIVTAMILKMVDIILAAILHSIKQLPSDGIYYLSTLMVIVSLLIILGLINQRKKRKCLHSTAIFVFWLTMFASSLPVIYSLSLKFVRLDEIASWDEILKIMMVALFTLLMFVMLVSNSFSSYIQPAMNINEQNLYPELFASIPQRWTFGWLTPLMWRVFRKHVESSKDAFLLPQDVSAAASYAKLHNAWMRRKPHGFLGSKSQLVATTLYSEEMLTNQLQNNANSSSTQRLLTSGEIETNDNDDDATLNSLPSVEIHQPLLAVTTTNFSVDSGATLVSSNRDDRVPTSCLGEIRDDAWAYRTNQQSGFSGIQTKETIPNSLARSYAFVLVRSLCAAFGPRLLVGWCLLFFRTFATYMSPLLLSALLQFMSKSNEYPSWWGYCLTGGFFAAAFLNTVLFNRGFYIAFSSALSCRSALMSAIYRKTLKLSSEARNDYTSGQIINFLTVDVDRILELFTYWHITWTALLQLTIAIIMLWNQLGVAMLAGLGVMLLFAPLNGLMTWLAQNFETKEMYWKDERMKCITEVVSGIKVLKLYAWEEAFEKLVSKLRGREMRELMRGSMTWGIVEANWILAPFVVLLASFAAYIALLNPDVASLNGTISKDSIPGLLTPEKIFVSLTLFNLLRVPLTNLPYAVSLMIMAYISIKRLALFFMAAELDQRSITRFQGTFEASKTALAMHNASFTWKSSGLPILKGLSLRVPRGSLIAVIGNVGAGKSSFLSAILGELERFSGTANQWGSMAYTSQMAWIQHSSLRDNILFGMEYEEAFYQSVIKNCELTEDIERMPDGDKTEIGERGLNLSGGQKHRVALARAVYQRRYLYLLDDPLAAVDVRIGLRLFDNVIGPKGMLKHSTRIFVTNAYQWLPQCDFILVLEAGNQVHFESFHDLKSSTIATRIIQGLNLIASDKESSEGKAPGSIGDTSTAIPIQFGGSNIRASKRYCSSWTACEPRLSIADELRRKLHWPLSSSFPCELVSNHPLSNYDESVGWHCVKRRRGGKTKSLQTLQTFSGVEEAAKVNPEHLTTDNRHPIVATNSVEENDDERGVLQEVRLVEDEDLLQGRVSWRSYAVYFVARGITLSVVACVSYLVFATTMVFSNKWLQTFADDRDFAAAGETIVDPQANASRKRDAALVLTTISQHYLNVYSCMGLVLTCCILLCVFIGILSSFKASTSLHRRLLRRVLRAPCSFFDTTPQGRILNRFSSDINNIDHTLSHAIDEVFSGITETVIIIIVVFASLRPWYLSLSSLVVFASVYLTVQVFYMPTSRQARRLSSITRSPLLAHCSETAANALGASVVRAHGKVDEFIAIADSLIDENGLYVYIRSISNRWLDFRLDMLSCVFLTFTAIVTVYARDQIPAGMAGFLISYALTVPETLSWLVKTTAQLESSAVAIERVNEYLHINQEAAWDKSTHSPPPADWPGACCKLEFISATVTYNPPVATTDDSAGTKQTVKCRQTPAIDNLSIVLSGRPDERVVGIVGRTGAGKSTIAASVFRLTEATRDDDLALVNADDRPGPIFVDGIDISKLGLHEVRSRFSILPQEPVIFTGNLRFNLDPFQKTNDGFLWDALDKAHLGEWARSLPNGLDYHCGESGSVLSAGQRQLICLARVLLSCGGRVRLLILDEATSAMDPETDRLVMETLLSDVFKDATIIIIAHRLSTIMSANRVVVMSFGKVIESGKPKELIDNKKSVFADINALPSH